MCKLFAYACIFQPSSSLRAAELLEASGAGLLSFSSFPRSDSGSGLASLSFTDETLESVNDPDFCIVLKRLSKKDATTKLKVMI